MNTFALFLKCTAKTALNSKTLEFFFIYLTVFEILYKRSNFNSLTVRITVHDIFCYKDNKELVFFCRKLRHIATCSLLPLFEINRIKTNIVAGLLSWTNIYCTYTSDKMLIADEMLTILFRIHIVCMYTRLMAHNNGHSESSEDWGERERQHTFFNMQVPDRYIGALIF